MFPILARKARAALADAPSGPAGWRGQVLSAAFAAYLAGRPGQLYSNRANPRRLASLWANATDRIIVVSGCEPDERERIADLVRQSGICLEQFIHSARGRNRQYFEALFTDAFSRLILNGINATERYLNSPYCSAKPVLDASPASRMAQKT